MSKAILQSYYSSQYCGHTVVNKPVSNTFSLTRKVDQLEIKDSISTEAFRVCTKYYFWGASPQIVKKVGQKSVSKLEVR